MHQVSACCRYSLKYQWSGSIACTITVVDMSHVTRNTKFVVTVVSHVASCSEREGHTQESIGYITVQCCSHTHMYVAQPLSAHAPRPYMHAHCCEGHASVTNYTVLFHCHPPGFYLEVCFFWGGGKSRRTQSLTYRSYHVHKLIRSELK